MTNSERSSERWVWVWVTISTIFCVVVGGMSGVTAGFEYYGMHEVASSIEPVSNSVLRTDIALLTGRYAVFLVPISLVLFGINFMGVGKKRGFLLLTLLQWCFLWAGLVLAAILYYSERHH